MIIVWQTIHKQDVRQNKSHYTIYYILYTIKLFVFWFMYYGEDDAHKTDKCYYRCHLDMEGAEHLLIKMLCIRVAATDHQDQSDDYYEHTYAQCDEVCFAKGEIFLVHIFIVCIPSPPIKGRPGGVFISYIGLRLSCGGICLLIGKSRTR